MHLFPRPPERQVRRLLAAAQLPADDLTAGHLENFFGCGTEQAPLGVAGLEICGPDALLRSLAVDEAARGQGCGRALVAAVERHARAQGVRHMYLLTITAARFFEALGYRMVSRDRAPEGVRATSEFSVLCPSTAAFMTKDLA